MTRLGYQIPNFTYPGVGPADLFDAIAYQAKEADTSGFDTVLVMDHFYQLPMLGDPDQFMLECYSLLSGLARETKNVRLSALVTGNTYRNPAVLAKTVTTLDVVSEGRAQLGIGAGWYELEHDAFGIEFGTFTDRFEKLEEALQIIIPMLRGERPSLDGQRYTAKDAINEPPAVGHIPVMIGGSGEKKTLSWQKTACIAPTSKEAQSDLVAYFLRRGLDLASMSEDEQAVWLGNFIWGDPDSVGEQFAAQLQPGIDGFTINMPANGHIEGRVELLGQTLAPLIK